MAGDRGRSANVGAHGGGALREGHLRGKTLLSLTYKGHALVDGEKVAMRDFMPHSPERPLELPVILLIGTSMSAGKTTSGKAIVRLLEQAGLRVVGAKLAGAAR